MVRALLGALDVVVAVLGLVLLAVGVAMVFGTGWALMVAGVLLIAAGAVFL